MRIIKIYNRSSPLSLISICLVLLFAVALHNACNERNPKNIQDTKPGITSGGPADTANPKPQILGDVTRGKEVFRFETLETKGFGIKLCDGNKE